MGRRIYSHYNIVNNINKQSLLIKIEDNYDFKDTVISGYQLQSNKEFKDIYIASILKQAFNNLKKVDFFSIINLHRAKINILTFILCTLFFILYASLIPYNYKISFSRFLNPEYRIKYQHKIVRFEVNPKNIRILEGSDVSFELITYGKVKDAFLVLKNQGNIVQEKMVLTQISNENASNKIYIYQYTLKNIYDDFNYYGETIQTRDNIKIKSPEYKLYSVKEPLVQDLKLVYIYPSYTGLQSKVVSDNGNIEAVERTTIRISGKINNNLKKAVLYYNSRRYQLSVSEEYFKGQFFLNKSGKYFIKFKDKNNNTNTKPVNYSVIVVKDNPPIVDITRPGSDITLQDVVDLPLEIYAQDDYRINDLKLFYRIKKAFTGRESPWKKINLNIIKKQFINHQYKWKLSELRFLPGDLIEYYAQVYDGYKPVKDHVVQSKKYLIKFPTVDEMYAQADQEQQKNIKTVEDLLKDQQNIYKENQKLLKDLENKKELSYIQKKEVEQIKKNQEKIQESVEKLSEQIKRAEENVRNKNMFSMEVLKKMNAIQKMLQEIKDKHIHESLTKLNSALKDIKLSSLKKKMLGQKLTQEKILKRLDKTLSMLKDLRNKQKLESMKKVTDELIKKQKDLLKDTLDKKNQKKDISNKSLKERQDHLKDIYNNLEKQMKEFEKELKEQNSELKDQMSAINQNYKKQNLESDYNQSTSHLEKNNLSQSMEKQKQILSKLNSMSNKMGDMQRKGQQMNLAKLLSIIDETVFLLLKSSEKIENYHAKIETQIKPIEKFYDIKEKDNELYRLSDNNEIAEDFIFLERNIRWIKINLEDNSKETMTISSDFLQKFEELAETISSARKDLAEKRVFNTSNWLVKALLHNNIIIKELLEAKENLKNQMQQQASQGMGDSLNQIADGQEQLNQMTERLQGQIGKQGMSSQTQEYLEELAFQQEMIKKNLENFINNFQQAGKLLGDLNQAAKEMKDIQKKLKSKKIDQDVLDKQKRVLKRLLDSEKSLYVEDKAKKRKADTAKTYKASSPAELKEEKVEYKNKTYYFHMNKYPIEYKKLIDDYFKVLNSVEP